MQPDDSVDLSPPPALPPGARPVSPRFLRAAIAIGCLFLLLMATLLRHEWSIYIDTRNAVAAFDLYRDTLVAMEKVSAERGPMNAALGDAHMQEGPPPSLQLARQAANTAIATVAQELEGRACSWCTGEQLALQRLKSDLAAARADADALLRLPGEARTDAALTDAVMQMVRVARQFGPLIDASQLAAVDKTNGALSALQMARFAAVLRDEAGLLGSRFTSALAARRPLDMDEQLKVERSYGRVQQLRLAIESIAATHPALTSGKFTKVNEQYFTHGIAYVATVRALTGGPDSPLPTTAEFAAQYVPTMAPIIAFRDEMLARAQATLRHQRTVALLRCIGFFVAGLVLALLSVTLLWLFRRYVIAPFTDATLAIVAIARGDLSAILPSHPYHREEVHSLFRALDVLRAQSRQRTALEQQRDELIEQLQTMAETDALTGLLNRRGFENRARLLKTLSHRADTAESYITLVEFDLDHFKRINDTYGHPTGDQVLKTIGALCRDTWRHEDIVARTGGEEFAVLLATREHMEALLSVERFRTKMQQTTLPAADGTEFMITASFGVVVSRLREMPDVATMLSRADALLYRAKAEGRNRVVADTLSEAGTANRAAR
ncbi:MAG TPA: GGDEF domain-containing protein [Paraburkholderia sp.]|jgi:diguanylate cyclase (GGDEF)-like protein